MTPAATGTGAGAPVSVDAADGAHRRSARVDRLVALALALVAALSLQMASRSLGVPRDEVIYFNAAEQQIAYYGELLTELGRGRLRALGDARLIDRYFASNREHPPLMKTLFGLSWRLLHRCDCPRETGLHPLVYPQRHRTLGLLTGSQAMRLPSHLLWGVLVGAVYLFGARWRGRLAGLAAAALVFLMPRTFFHAQLACFDAPVAALIFLITWAYLRAQQSGTRRWAVTAGGLLGLGLLTKHNTYFLPPVLLGHALWVRRGLLAEARAASGRARILGLVRYVLQPWAVAMAILGPVLLFVGWPHLWPSPARRFAEYVAFHLHHVHYNIEYLGRNYNLPPYPWHYVPVMTLFTVPVTTLGLAALGLRSLSRRPGDAGGPAPVDPCATGLLVVLGLAWPMLVIMRPGTPIFGAEKHWMPAMPFLALLAGAGLRWALAQARAGLDGALRLTRTTALGLSAAVLVLVLLPPLLETRRSHPYGLSHYNVLAGGPTGAATRGMNRQFWGYAARGVWPFLNSRPPLPSGGARAVYFHDASLQLPVAQREGLLRRDVYDAGIEEPGVRASETAMVVLERHFNKYEYWIWDAYGTTQPSYVLTHEGVPLVTVYERPEPRPVAGAGRAP
ncbi:MAG: glycosyltransferase family 39 protein [Polyangia bacterium]